MHDCDTNGVCAKCQQRFGRTTESGEGCVTHGFANHEADKVVVWGDDYVSDRPAQLTCQSRENGKVVLAIGIGSKALAMTFGRREAIFLRNRLTAFIEEEVA